MIGQRLKELEERGMVNREVLSERPIAITYSLTEFGRSALGILDQIRIWSEQYELGENGATATHR